MTHGDGGAGHVVSPRTYLAIFTVLLILTFVTVRVAFVDLDRLWPHLNIVVALGIAIVKAVLVILFFMHVKYSSRLTRLVIAGAFLWLGILIVATLDDYATRGRVNHTHQHALSLEDR